MVNIKETHLTRRQFEVLKRRREGKSLTQIAEELGTSRSNVSRIIKIAERNVERARNTLKLIGTIEWPIKIDVRAGSNVYSVSEQVFRKADERGIKITRNYSELTRLITETLGRKNLKRRKALTDFGIMVSKEGKVEIL
ncbi:MAG: Tfx family DNA-binding protein [Candidatus Hodarchaeaceae archaeon]|nr:Tfx family DNA-binding protein [Candidatus Hodarchaeaceae archaeon]